MNDNFYNLRDNKMRFCDRLDLITYDESYRNQYIKYLKKSYYDKQYHEVKDREYKRLTDKYGVMIWESIERAAMSGKNEKYINLKNKDFTVDFPGLNNPVKFKEMWIREVMKNKNSKYHKTHPILKQTYNISGLYVEVWKNQKGTIRFGWSRENLGKESWTNYVNHDTIINNCGWDCEYR